MSDAFIDEWRRLIQEEPGRQVGVQGEHPLQLFYGSDQAERPILFVISDAKPGMVSLSDAVTVERGVRQADGRWTLTLTLRDRRFVAEFMRLGDDLVSSTGAGRNEVHALRLMVDTVEHWRALFAYGASDHLSAPQIRGLVGELWFGFCRITETESASAVLHAWDGPFDSPQDFNLTSGLSYEVKTIHADTKTIRISSAEQLDPGWRTLDLVVVTVTDVDNTTDDALSLPGMLTHVRTLLDGNATDLEELRQRLRALRVDVDDSYYDDFWFRVDACTTYRVDLAFPAIRRGGLNPTIDTVRYELAIHGIAEFISSTWARGSDAADHTGTPSGPTNN